MSLHYLNVMACNTNIPFSFSIEMPANMNKLKKIRKEKRKVQNTVKDSRYQRNTLLLTKPIQRAC